ncbi:Synaptotagmin-like protein 2, partial [Coemansia sp. RSA 2702]
SDGGELAAGLHVAQQYVEAFGKIAKESNTIVVPAAANDVSSMVAQAMSVFSSVSANQKKHAAAYTKRSKPSDEGSGGFGSEQVGH